LIARLLLSLAGAAVISLFTFWVLQRLTSSDQNVIAQRDEIRVIDFVRLQHESEPQQKERIKPQKPKPLPKPEPVKAQVQQPPVPNQTMAPEPMPLDLDLPVDLSAKGMLGDAVVSAGMGRQEINTNVIPLSRVNPIYPRRAKMMKIEGYVQVEFTITPAGGVTDIAVVKSYPEGVFDASTKRALLRWTFKPKVVDGKPVSQRAGLTINFRLNQ